MPHNLEPIFYGDVEVRDKNGLISLTDMWIAAGKPAGKHDPRQWARKPRAVKSGSSGKTSTNGGAGYEFIDFIAKKLNVSAEHVYKTAQGRYGGSWAHWQIALSYAKYLSPEFHAWANEVIKERVEEDKDPELGIERSRDRAITNWKKQGKNDSQIGRRIDGIKVRNVFTKVLGDRGVEGKGFGYCTNNIYIPVIGEKAADAKKSRGLKSGENLRDNMDMVELTAVMFAETLATDKIQRENRVGINPCASACLKAGMDIKLTLDKHEESIKKPIVELKSPDTFLSDRINKMRENSKN